MVGSRRQLRLLPGILVLILAVVFPLFASRATTASAASTYGPLVTAALKYVGQQEGQCYSFMQQVVREATGRTVGPDYRLGYLAAGAVEVMLQQARSGDIIQSV